MQSSATSVEDYLKELPENRREAISKIRDVVNKNLPKGFEETMSYGMIGYVVPHSIYPDGYHCTPNLPLPFFAVASQKKSINIYHMMLYADKHLHDWFTVEYSKFSKSKLDMGKSCVRFKKLNDIPYELIGELMSKIAVQQWIDVYEKNYKR